MSEDLINYSAAASSDHKHRVQCVLLDHVVVTIGQLVGWRPPTHRWQGLVPMKRVGKRSESLNSWNPAIPGSSAEPRTQTSQQLLGGEHPQHTQLNLIPITISLLVYLCLHTHTQLHLVPTVAQSQTMMLIIDPNKAGMPTWDKSVSAGGEEWIKVTEWNLGDWKEF